MLNNFINNLKIINKTIHQLNFLLTEDIDFDLFLNKIIFDIQFIDDFLLNYNEYIYRTKDFSKEEYISYYFNTIKKFYTLLIDMEKNQFFKDPKNKSLLKSKISGLEKRISNIKNYNFHDNILKSEKQIINEEEYNLLLKILE